MAEDWGTGKLLCEVFKDGHIRMDVSAEDDTEQLFIRLKNLEHARLIESRLSDAIKQAERLQKDALQL